MKTTTIIIIFILLLCIVRFLISERIYKCEILMKNDNGEIVDKIPGLTFGRLVSNDWKVEFQYENEHWVIECPIRKPTCVEIHELELFTGIANIRFCNHSQDINQIIEITKPDL